MISASAGTAAVARHATRVGSHRLVTQGKLVKFTLLGTRAVLAHIVPVGAISARTFSGTPAVFLTKNKKPSGKKKSQSLKSVLQTATARQVKSAKLKKAAEKKKKASAKVRKPVLKTVPKSKITPEMREKRKQQIKKREIKERKAELKAASLIDQEPQRVGPNAFFVFCQERGPALHAQGLRIPKISYALSEEYKALSQAELDRLNAQAAATKTKSRETYEAWLKAQDPATILVANKARRSMKRLGMPTRFPIDDSRIPTISLSAYTAFIKDHKADYDPTLGTTKFIINMAAKWKTLTAAQKKPYEEIASQDKVRYSEEMKSIGG